MTQENQVPPPESPPDRPLSPVAVGALALAVAVAILALMAGFGSRLGLWHFSTGFTLLRWAVYGAAATAAIALLAIVLTRPAAHRRGLPAALVALVLALLVVAIPVQQRRAAQGAPPIHDITTDTENPPEFVAIAPLRADAPNPVEYEAEPTARLQRSAYPEIRPVILDLPAEDAFYHALDAADAQGWHLVDADLAELRIEATDRTFWFGFYDDVVVRLTPLNGRTVVDVRSKSRVGRGDWGTNARRVRGYLRTLGAS